MEMKSRELFDFLANESDSPLNGLLSAAKSSRGKIARPTFNRAAAHIFKSPVMEKLSKDKQHTLVKNFFKALEKNSRERKWFTTSVYFESICVVFDDVLQLSREQYGDYKLGSIFEVLAPVNQVDLTIINTRASRLTTVPIVRALKDVLSAQFDVSDDMI
jgi:hypothetical protein